MLTFRANIALKETLPTWKMHHTYAGGNDSLYEHLVIFIAMMILNYGLGRCTVIDRNTLITCRDTK